MNVRSGGLISGWKFEARKVGREPDIQAGESTDSLMLHMSTHGRVNYWKLHGMIKRIACNGSVTCANPPTCIKCATCVKRSILAQRVWHNFSESLKSLNDQSKTQFNMKRTEFRNKSVHLESKSFEPCPITLRAQTSMRCKWAHLLPGLPFHHICNQKCAALKHHASRGVRLVLVSMRRQVILMARHFSSVLQHFSWRKTAECANGGPLIQQTRWTFPLFPRKRSNLQWDLKQGCEQSPSTTHKSVCRDVQPPKSPPHSSFFSCLIFFPTQLKPEEENFPSLFFIFYGYCLGDVIFIRAKWHFNAQSSPGFKIFN